MRKCVFDLSTQYDGDDLKNKTDAHTENNRQNTENEYFGRSAMIERKLGIVFGKAPAYGGGSGSGGGVCSGFGAACGCSAGGAEFSISHVITTVSAKAHKFLLDDNKI